MSEVSYGEKLEQQQHSNQQPSAAASLFSTIQLKLPQFRIRSPNGSTTEGESESTPSSPMFSRRGSQRRKETLAQAPSQKLLHQSLSRHQSLSTNNTPVRWDR